MVHFTILQGKGHSIHFRSICHPAPSHTFDSSSVLIPHCIQFNLVVVQTLCSISHHGIILCPFSINHYINVDILQYNKVILSAPSAIILKEALSVLTESITIKEVRAVLHIYNIITNEHYYLSKTIDSPQNILSACHQKYHSMQLDPDP